MADSNLAARVMLDQKSRAVNTLAMFRPTEPQEPFVRQFAKDGGLEFLLGGGQRSGKTVLASCCMGSLALDKPITLRSGEQIHIRPDRWRGEALKMWLCGYDHKHIGKTLFRVLFKPNLFRVIRDQRTGKWRSWDPTLPEDKNVYNLTRPSPPLIRDSDIVGGLDGISWENKKENQISSCELVHDGTRLEFFASTGAMPTGDPAHVIWADERFEDDRWISELLMRLADYRGRFLWTAWPNTEPSVAMSELEDRASKQLGSEKAKSFYFRLDGNLNPYTDGEHRDAILGTMDEDTRRARSEGILNMDRWRTYPRFSRFVHRVLQADIEQDDALAKAVRTINGIPSDWTRYLILDPGTANPAVLFVAVPPPELGDFIVPYDELYPHYSDAEKIAKLVAGKTLGQYFEDFIADSHACNQTPMGFSGTIGQNYAKHFAAEKLRCRRQGSNFSYGSDDVDTRVQVLQSTMTIRSNGTPRLRILGCPELCKQLETYKWGKDPKGNPTDKPAKYQKIDVAQCFDATTEVLTNGGWKYFKDLAGDEHLATVNMSSDQIEYQQPSRIIDKEYSGDMFQFGGHKLDACVTPDHRMIVYPPRENEAFIAREAQDLLAWDRIKLHAKWTGVATDTVLVPSVSGGHLALEKEIDPGLFAEFLGWYIAEGCCAKYTGRKGKGYRVHISQNDTWKKVLLKGVLDQLPWTFTNTPNGFVCSSKQLWTYLQGFGDRSYVKRVPEWIKWASSETIRRFLIGAVLGDGWNPKADPGRRGYGTASKSLADDIQELFIKIGVTASVMRRPPSTYEIRGQQGATREFFVVSQWRRPRAGLRNHAFEPNYKTIKYDGRVYCATVPNSTMIVRRNGRPMVSGNCLEYFTSRSDCGYFKPPMSRPEDLKSPGVIAMSIAKQMGLDQKKKPEQQSVYCGAGTPSRW